MGNMGFCTHVLMKERCVERPLAGLLKWGHKHLSTALTDLALEARFPLPAWTLRGSTRAGRAGSLPPRLPATELILRVFFGTIILYVPFAAGLAIPPVIILRPLQRLHPVFYSVGGGLE